MKEITKVVVDAMGGDNAPHEIIKGAVEAVGKSDAIHVILVGKEDVINQELSGYTYNKAIPRGISLRHFCALPEARALCTTAHRRFCFSRKFRCGSCRGTASGWTYQRGGKTTACTADPDRKRILHFDRLWGECRCKTFTSGAVCQDGFDLYGTYYGSQESEGCDRQYRS